MRTTHASTKCRTGNDRYPFCFFLSQLLLGFRKMLPLPPIVKNIHRNFYDSLIYFFFLSFGLLFLFLLRLLLILFLFYVLYFIYFFSFSVFVFIFSLSCVYSSPVSFQNLFLDRPQPGPIKSVLLVIIGWLVGNAVFSETALRIFLTFYI